MQLKIKKVHPDAVIPTYATDGSACFDLYSVEDGIVDYNGSEAVAFRTGLAFEVPDGHALMVYSRSSHGFKCSVRLANCVGVLDSDYRGELVIGLAADDYGFLEVEAGDRIAQAMVIPVPKVQFVEVDELTETERGAGGFGSTGK